MKELTPNELEMMRFEGQMRMLDNLNELCGALKETKDALKETKEEFNSLTEDIKKLKANKPPIYWDEQEKTWKSRKAAEV